MQQALARLLFQNHFLLAYGINKRPLTTIANGKLFIKRCVMPVSATGITKPDYDKKLQEIMDRVQTLVMEMEEHSRADHDYKTTVGTVLSVARRSREIFEGAELPEKRQFINFLVQNPKLKDRELVFELKQPMNTVLELAHYSASKRKTIGISTDRPSWLGVWGARAGLILGRDSGVANPGSGSLRVRRK